MRKLLLLFAALTLTALGQSFTQIQSTSNPTSLLHVPSQLPGGGQVFNGTITITFPGATVTSTVYLPVATLLTVNSGAYNISLLPTDLSSTTGLAYYFWYQPNASTAGAKPWGENVLVPTSASPITYSGLTRPVPPPIPLLSAQMLSTGVLGTGRIVLESALPSSVPVTTVATLGIISDGNCAETPSFSLPGLNIGDVVSGGVSVSLPTSIIVSAKVVGANSVVAIVCNWSGSYYTIPTATYTVVKFE